MRPQQKNNIKYKQKFDKINGSTESKAPTIGYFSWEFQEKQKQMKQQLLG